MNKILYKLWLWFWHLLPANPILVRVVYGASRRSRHLWLRTGYLAALLLVVLFSLLSAIGQEAASLAELAKGASQTFKYAAITQLALMCFMAPVFTASAITQERDAQTFNILLSTPLTNAQIVFGSLLSRLYFVIMLLVAGLPIFLTTMVYGGVTTSQIVESFALSGATAILTGALAIFVAMMGVGTRRTIFSFYLVIALYLLCVYMLGRWDRTWIEASEANLWGRRMSWLTPIHPFLALDVALNRVYAPPYSRLGDYSAVVRYALAYPSAFYVMWTTTLAFLLTTASILFVRRGVKTGEPTLLGPLLDRLGRHSDQLTRPPRAVWRNPVAWREAKTRSTGGGLLRLAIIVGGFIGPGILFLYHLSGAFAAGEVRLWLSGMVIVQFALALIIALNTASTSMTKEKESRTMDLLLSTPLTSKYILWGKLRGLVSFTMPLLFGPVVAVLAFGIYGLTQGGRPPAIWVETAIEVAALLVIYTALACVTALRISLVSRTNMTAVMYSVGVAILFCGIASMIGFPFVNNLGPEGGALVAPFTPFTAIWFMVNPAALFDTASEFTQGTTVRATTRVLMLFGCIAATAVYAFVVWNRYSALVRGFDMTMRKQSGT